MNKTLFIAVVCVVLLGSSSPRAAVLDCKNPVTTFDMLECNTRDRLKAEGQMNGHLAKIRKSNQVDVVALDESQRHWQSYVMQECSWEASVFAGGTLENVTYGACLADETRARAGALAKRVVALGL